MNAGGLTIQGRMKRTAGSRGRFGQSGAPMVNSVHMQSGPESKAPAGGAALAAASPAAEPQVATVREGAITIPEGELIILRIKPSLWMLVSGLFLPWTVGLVLWLRLLDTPVSMVLGAGGNVLPHVSVLGWTLPGFLSRFGLFLVLLCLAATLWRFAEWWSRSYVLTDRRVVTQTGVLRQSTIDAPLRKIQHVSVHRGLEERALGVGTLVFATAGIGGEFQWYQISRPHQRLVIVRETIERYARGGSEP
jgi:membrane protein YdbS with pleckstrin-like domain